MLIVFVYSKYSMTCNNILRTMQKIEYLPPIETLCVDSGEAKKLLKNSRITVKTVPTFLVFNEDGRVELYDRIDAIQFINEVIKNSMPPPPPPAPRVLPLPREEQAPPPPSHTGGYSPPANRPPPRRKEYVPEVVPPENDAINAIVSGAVLQERRPSEEVRRVPIATIEDNYAGGMPNVQGIQGMPGMQGMPPGVQSIQSMQGMHGAPMPTEHAPPSADGVGIPQGPPVPGRSKSGKVDISAILAQAQAEQQQRGLQQQ